MKFLPLLSGRTQRRTFSFIYRNYHFKTTIRNNKLKTNQSFESRFAILVQYKKRKQYFRYSSFRNKYFVSSHLAPPRECTEKWNVPRMLRTEHICRYSTAFILSVIFRKYSEPSGYK